MTFSERPPRSFDSSGASRRGRGALKIVGPPTWPLLAALLAAVTSAASALIWHPVRGHVMGYILGSTVTLGLVGLFRHGDLARSSEPFYSPMRTLQRLAVLTALLGFGAAAVHAWFVADALAR